MKNKKENVKQYIKAEICIDNKKTTGIYTEIQATSENIEYMMVCLLKELSIKRPDLLYLILTNFMEVLLNDKK